MRLRHAESGYLSYLILDGLDLGRRFDRPDSRSRHVPCKLIKVYTRPILLAVVLKSISVSANQPTFIHIFIHHPCQAVSESSIFLSPASDLGIRLRKQPALISSNRLPSSLTFLSGSSISFFSRGRSGLSDLYRGPLTLNRGSKGSLGYHH
jgi:hypothetical protein